MFIGLLNFSGLLAIKCISLNNQACKAKQALLNLNPDEHNQCECKKLIKRCVYKKDYI